MSRIRPELPRGIVLVTIFLGVVISSSILVPYPILHSEYQHVSIDAIELNPSLFEGIKISTQITVLSLSESNSTFIATTEEDVLVFFLSEGSLLPSEGRVLVRGVSWISTNNSIVVDEFYVMDYSSSIIRSIPGIILFVILFFMVFHFDMKNLVFRDRSEDNA